jgi:hypothetical protein
MVPLHMSYDWASDIQIVHARNTADSGFSLSFKNPFEDLFSSVASFILIWIVIICTVIAAIVFGIFLLRCICRYIWKIHLNNNNNTFTHGGNAYNGNYSGAEALFFAPDMFATAREDSN